MAYKFENYGDVNPIDDDGLFIAKDDERKDSRCYMVVSIRMYDDEDKTKWLYEEAYIDLDDFTKKQIDEATEGIDMAEPMSDVNLVYYLIQYNGCYQLSGYQHDPMTSRQEVIDELAKWGIIET